MVCLAELKRKAFVRQLIHTLFLLQVIDWVAFGESPISVGHSDERVKRKMGHVLNVQSLFVVRRRVLTAGHGGGHDFGQDLVQGFCLRGQERQSPHG